MDHFACRLLVERSASVADPVGQAVAAEPGQAHQLDILGIVAMAQMPHQSPKSGGGDGIIQRFEGICGVRIRIFGTAHGHTLGFSAPLCHRDRDKRKG